MHEVRPPEETKAAAESTVPVESDSVSIKETDLTQKSLEEIRSELSQRIRSGAVLHGSPRADLTELQPSSSADYTPYKQREETAVFATDQPFPALFRGAFGAHLQVWRQAAFFQIDAFDDVPEKGYIYVLNGDDFIQDFQDPAEYTSTDAVVPIERIAVSTKELLAFVRTGEEVVTDFSNGVLTAPDILPEAVRTQDCILAVMTITTLLERVGFLDYTYNPEKESSLAQKDLLDRIEILLQYYSVFLQSEKIKDPSVRPFVEKAISKCVEVTYDIGGVYDPMVINQAYGIIGIVENL